MASCFSSAARSTRRGRHWSADERGSATGAFRLGFLLEEIGQVAEAEAAYRRAVDRGSASAAGNLATMLRQRGDQAGADAVTARLDEVTGHVSADAILAEAVGSGVPLLSG